MKIDLNKLKYSFRSKPLLVGGQAMEYYGLRKAGDDIDFIISAEDYEGLAKLYPENRKDLFGDLGVAVHEFELWKCILLFEYDFLFQGAIEEDEIRVISLEKLLFMKALAISEPKYEQDVRLIVAKIHNIQYGKDERFDTQHFQSQGYEQFEFLEQTSKLMKSIIAETAHEIRAPLFGISGFSELLLHHEAGTLNDETRLEFIERILENSRGVIKDFTFFVDLSRIAVSQEYGQNFEEVDFKEVYEEVAGPNLPPIKQHGTLNVWTNKHLITLILGMIFSPLPYSHFKREITMDVDQNQTEVTLNILMKYDQTVSFLKDDTRLLCCQIGIKRLKGKLSWEQPKAEELFVTLTLPVYKPS
jgi:signal transduction histidine kinase